MWFKLASATFQNSLGKMSDLSNSWPVTYTLSGGISKNSCPSFVTKNNDGTQAAAAFTATFTINSGESLNYIKAFIGGEQVGNTIESGNSITINANLITGPVTIEASATGSSSGTNTPVTPPAGGTTTLTLYKSAVGNSILDYQNVWKMFGAGSLATLGSQIIGVDISAYAGQTMTITAAQSVIDGANYAMICSNLPNAYIKSLAELDGYNSFGTAADYIAENYDNLIESFNVSVTAETTNTITKTIPSGAKYLFFSNLSAKCTNPSVVINGSSSSSGNTTTTPLTFYKTANDAGMSIFYYQDALRTNSNTTFIGLGSEIIGVDVSSYVGKTLKITSTQSVVSGAQYGVFMSAPLLSTITPDKLPTFTTINANVPTDNVINYIQISDTAETTNTKNIVVPTGAKYLYFSNLRKKQTSEPAIVVEV